MACLDRDQVGIEAAMDQGRLDPGDHGRGGVRCSSSTATNTRTGAHH